MDGPAFEGDVEVVDNETGPTPRGEPASWLAAGVLEHAADPAVDEEVLDEALAQVAGER